MENKKIKSTKQLKANMTRLFNKFAKSQGYSDWNCYSAIELGIDCKPRKEEK